MLARHVWERDLTSVPEAAVDAARREILWALGTAVAGAGTANAARVMAYAREQGSREDATALGFGDRLPIEAAGFVNGYFAKALEYEDKWWIGTTHAYAIGTAVVPAAFAAAEYTGGLDGKKLLAAVVLASDVQARMVKAVANPTATGWNPTYLHAAIGAALAAGKVWGLDPAGLVNALGLAYAQTAGNRQGLIEAVPGNGLQMGFAVRDGLAAARLALMGVTGPQHALTGQFGLYPLFYRNVDVRVEALTDGLGERFEGTRLGFKAYPCGAVAHPVLDTVLALSAEHPLGSEMIEEVEVLGSPRLRVMTEPLEVKQRPQTAVETLFSLPWGVACAIVDGHVGLNHYSAAALREQRYHTLAQKVTVRMREEGAAGGARVTVRLRDGRVLVQEQARAPRGHPDNPLSTAELVDRYRDCVRRGPKPLTAAATEEAKDLVLSLGDVPDVCVIPRFLGGAEPAAGPRE